MQLKNSKNRMVEFSKKFRRDVYLPLNCYILNYRQVCLETINFNKPGV